MVSKRDFTDRALKTLDPAKPRKRYFRWDAQVSGFGVRVSDRASKEGKAAGVSFVLVTRYPGAKSPAPRTIGHYPTITLAKARDIAREWRDLIAKGIDPAAQAEAERRAVEAAKREAERRAQDTFRAAYEAFAEEHLSTLRTGRVVKGVIAKHVYPILGDRPLTEITRAEANDLLRATAKRLPTHARRIKSYLHKFGDWAEEDGRIEESPFANLKRFGKEHARERVLSDLEIRAIWQASAGMAAFGRAVRFMLATGQRRSEVGDMVWKEFDEGKKLWTLPRERTKADRTHEVPISPLALSILGETPKIGEHVFATRGPRAPQGRPATTTPISGWSKFKDRLDALALAELKRLAGDDAALPKWHLHDLRRSAATQMARLGVDRLVISKTLNHAEGGVTKIYDKYGYLPEKRQGLERWGARLAQIVEGQELDNIVSLVAVRG